MKTAEIKLEVQSDHDIHSEMGFSANWRDETHRYHVWIGLRRDVDGERVPYPVKIGETIYKNTIADSRTYNTKRLDINAKAHAAVKSEIKRIATYDTLVAMFNERRETISLADMQRAEAERLNRLYDAWKLVEASSVDDRMAIGLI